jgi:hypothetical protein
MELRDETPLWTKSAAELAAGYRVGAFSPTDALEDVLNRVRAVNSVINAIVTLDEEGARDAALASELRFRAGKPLGALDGIPMTIKDSVPVAGIRTTWGESPLRRSCSRRGRFGRGAAAGGRSSHPRHVELPGIYPTRLHRQSCLRDDAEPVGRGAHPGRIKRRCCGRSRKRSWPCRDRHGRGGLNPPAVLVYGARRPEAVTWPRAAGRDLSNHITRP